MIPQCPDQIPWARPKDARVYGYEEWRHATRRRLWKRVSSMARQQRIAVTTNGHAFVLSQGEWSSSYSADYDGLQDACDLLESMIEM